MKSWRKTLREKLNKSKSFQCLSLCIPMSTQQAERYQHAWKGADGFKSEGRFYWWLKKKDEEKSCIVGWKGEKIA